MRRRVRETFVLGAERVFDEAELDLRNEAEADHEPTIELDHAAAAEPAIGPQAQPADAHAGVGATRDRRPSGLPRRPRRPRPSAVAVIAAGCGLGALAVFRGDGADESSERTVAEATAQPAAPAATHVAEGGPQQPHRQPSSRARNEEGRPKRTGADEAPTQPEVASIAHEGVPAVEQVTSPAPQVTPPAPIASTGPPASPVAPEEPVQTAASVRQEFGP